MGRRALAASALHLTATVLACSSPSAPAPVGAALVIVDTEMPVPRLASRLRVDVYSEDGTQWIESRETSRARPTDWPVSFGVSAPDATHEKVALVRLRAYPEGMVRDYLGERFAGRPSFRLADTLQDPPAPPATGEPKLFDAEARDVTPPTEPEPLVTIDRLVLVRIPAGQRGAMRVVLRGACVGTMADLAGRRSCVDTENVRVSVDDVEEPLDADTSTPPSLVGTFGNEVPCTLATRPPGTAKDGTPLRDEEVCLPGATFVFGSDDGGPDYSGRPKRVAVLPPFRMDKYEVTVGRWRHALAEGFSSPLGTVPIANDVGIPQTGNGDDFREQLCTWSTSPVGREDFPITCIGWLVARNFCKFYGGDLPTEAEWEYAAAVAGRPARTRYAWGGDDHTTPTCTRASYSRGTKANINDRCTSLGYGPSPVGDWDREGGDVALSGVVDMGGNVLEWVRDAAGSYTANCWAAAPLVSPSCVQERSYYMMLRGGGWALTSLELATGNRESADKDSQSPAGGFRCVREATP